MKKVIKLISSYLGSMGFFLCMGLILAFGKLSCRILSKSHRLGTSDFLCDNEAFWDHRFVPQPYQHTFHACHIRLLSLSQSQFHLHSSDILPCLCPPANFCQGRSQFCHSQDRSVCSIHYHCVPVSSMISCYHRFACSGHHVSSPAIDYSTTDHIKHSMKSSASVGYVFMVKIRQKPILNGKSLVE